MSQIVTSKRDLPTAIVTFNGEPIKGLLDTGSLINKDTFNLINPKPTLEHYNGVDLGYGMSSIKILGQFVSKIAANGNHTDARVLVTELKCRNVLGYTQCTLLGLVQVTASIEDITAFYPQSSLTS